MNACVSVEQLGQMLVDGGVMTVDEVNTNLMDTDLTGKTRSGQSFRGSGKKRRHRGGGQCTKLDTAILITILGGSAYGVCVVVPMMAAAGGDWITIMRAKLQHYIDSYTLWGQIPPMADNKALLLVIIQGIRQSGRDAMALLKYMCESINDIRNTPNAGGRTHKRRKSSTRRKSRKTRR